MNVTFREARRDADAELVWSIIRPAVESGEVFCAPPDGGREGGLAYFWPASARVWLAEMDGRYLGCFYIRPNQTGNGDHVCNAGYCTHPDAAGKGIARAMLHESLVRAAALGYRAMQYNFVVASNTRAIDTWTRAGFQTVGRIPDAFRHPRLGMVDALVMYRRLI